MRLFHCAKFKKNLRADPKFEDVPFSSPKWPTCPKQFFLRKIIITFIYLLVPFIVKNFKKIAADPELCYEDVSFFGAKWFICHKKE